MDRSAVNAVALVKQSSAAFKNKIPTKNVKKKKLKMYFENEAESARMLDDVHIRNAVSLTIYYIGKYIRKHDQMIMAASSCNR